jgi:hypothetical protein
MADSPKDEQDASFDAYDFVRSIRAARRAELKEQYPEAPVFPKLLLETPLYATLWMPDVQEDGISALLRGMTGKPAKPYKELLAAFKGPLDAHCVQCGRESVFKGLQAKPNSETGHLAKWFFCQRNQDHELYFEFRFPDNDFLVTKIGQYPSLADFAEAEIAEYRKVLPNDLYREFKRAIGLSAHDVHIGSFIYLRRIFERLVEESRAAAAKASADWNDEMFAAARMDKKIEMLKTFLPPFLVENSGLYSILSKGVHELTEDECGALFPIVKSGIKHILDEKIASDKKAADMAETKAAITKAKSALKDR